MKKEENKTALATIARQDNILASIEIDKIAKPSSSDKEWALNLSSTSWLTGGKGSKFLRAVKSGYLWRVAYAVKLNDTYDEKGKFINENVGAQALYLAAVKNHESVVEYLLNEDFALNYSYGLDFLEETVRYRHIKALTNLIKTGAYSIDKEDGYVLFRAAIKGNTLLCSQLLSLGLKAERGLMMARNKGYPNAVNIIKEAVEIVKEKEEPKLIEKTSAPDKELAKDSGWDAMDDSTIVKHESIPRSNIELQTIFNFLSRDVTTICCVNGQAPATVTIRKFQDLESDSTLFVAWEKLKEQGKNPIFFTGNDNFIVHKPSKSQNIKIEGR